MQCESKGCEESAEFKVFWPGKMVKMCTKCKDRANGVANAMGFQLSTEEIGLPSLEEIQQTLAIIGK